MDSVLLGLGLYRLLANSRILDRQLPLVQAIVVLSNSKAESKIEKTPEMCKIIQIKNQADGSLYDYIMSFQDVVFSTEEIGIIVEFLKKHDAKDLKILEK